MKSARVRGGHAEAVGGDVDPRPTPCDATRGYRRKQLVGALLGDGQHDLAVAEHEAVAHLNVAEERRVIDLDDFACALGVPGGELHDAARGERDAGIAETRGTDLRPGKVRDDADVATLVACQSADPVIANE